MPEIEGLQELLGKMDALPLALQKTLIVRALRKGAEPIRVRAEELAPDDPETAGSRIKENIAIVVSDQTATGAIAKIGPTKKGFMAGWHEWGSAHQPARPFLRPAFDERQEEALQLVGEVLAEGIEAALRGNAL